MKKIFVLGSINMDFAIAVDRMPMAGESHRGSGFMAGQGGKGANQAVACKKLGGEDVRFFGAVGDDTFGKSLCESVRSYGVDVSGVCVKEGVSSGICMITLDRSRNDNYLIVDGGANDAADLCDFSEGLRRASEGDIFITQLEMSPQTVKEGLKFAKGRRMYTVLNPAPARKIGKAYLENVDLLVLNESECALLTGIAPTDEDAIRAAGEYFAALGVREVVVTLGHRGRCYFAADGRFRREKAKRVQAVDTTSAGDTFIGALAVKKAAGEAVADSLEFASRCSAITVSRKGASDSIPTLQEVLSTDFPE